MENTRVMVPMDVQSVLQPDGDKSGRRGGGAMGAGQLLTERLIWIVLQRKTRLHRCWHKMSRIRCTWRRCGM